VRVLEIEQALEQVLEQALVQALEQALVQALEQEKALEQLQEKALEQVQERDQMKEMAQLFAVLLMTEQSHCVGGLLPEGK
jgi:hypothetical protein